MTETNDNICEIHNIPMNAIKMQIPQIDPEYDEMITDDYGIPITTETVAYECPQCVLEKEQAEEREFYSSPSGFETTNIVQEKIRETEKRNPNEITIALKEERENFLDTYSPIISRLTDAPIEACRAMLQLLISCSLFRAEYSNSKGRIYPNLSFIWIAPSGSNKTPLIDNTIERLQSTIYQEFEKFGAVTGKGFRKEISRDKQSPIKPVMMIWDEMSTMSKDVKNDGTSDLYEVLSQAYDGKLTPYTSVRGGHERYSPLYSSFWISGVPSFLEQTDKSFWYQGFGLRSLFLKYELVDIKPIDDKELEEVEGFYRNLEADLSLMKDIRYVKTSERFMQRYNEFRRDILEKIQDAQKDILKSQDPEMFHIISKVKFPVLVMKLAMIHSAARWNFTEFKDAKSPSILLLDLEDLQTAISDLESYHANMIEMFNVWQELAETKSRIDNIKNVKDKIKRHISAIISSGKSFILTERDNNGVREYFASMSAEGKWIPHSALLRMSHLTSKSFTEIIETLIEQVMISKRDGIIEKNGVKHIITFYSLA